MTRSPTGTFRSSRVGRRVVALAVAGLVAVGCDAFRRAPLDVPPGHRLVLGEVVISGFSDPVSLDIAREDGTFSHELPVDSNQTPFVITLPPGHYQITRLRINDSRRAFPEEGSFPIRITFDVGEAAAIYVGRVQIERIVFARQLRIVVQDDYDRAVPALRARYPELPPTIARALMKPS